MNRALRPGAQSAPTSPVPLGDVSGRHTTRLREPAPHVQVAARNRQHLHDAVDSLAQGGPTSPVPFGDLIGNDVAYQGEGSADVEVARAIRHRYENRAVSAANASVHADPVGIAESR